MASTPVKTAAIALLTTMLWLLAGPSTHAQDAAATAPDQPDDDRPAITLDREAGVIDLAATMVDAQPQWLELIATTQGGREHEAIVTIAAKPSHIHLALVALGLEPGHPMRNRQDGDQIISEPPAGPELELFFVYDKDGQTHQTPVHQWVLDEPTGKPLLPGKWLFTGSVFREWKGREYYMADEAGNIASLVNFGDDLIARNTPMTQDNDFQQLQLNEDESLPYGSRLILRIRVVKPQAQPADPAETSDQPHGANPSPQHPDGPPK